MTQVIQVNVKPEMIKAFAGDIMVQPRTLMLDKPAHFLLEPMKPKRPANEKNEKDAIEGPHQVDPNRTASCAAVMPNIALFRATGNPYPLDPAHETVKTKECWSKYVPLSHALFIALREQTCAESKTANELIDDAVALSGVGRKADGSIHPTAMAVALDTLRDLRCYGFVDSDDASARFKTTKFRLKSDLDTLQTLPEYVAHQEKEAELAAAFAAEADSAAVAA